MKNLKLPEVAIGFPSLLPLNLKNDGENETDGWSDYFYYYYQEGKEDREHTDEK